MAASHASSQVDAIAIEDLMVPSDTPGVLLHLRHKWYPAAAPFSAERTVVLVHGATYSSESLFDVRLDGLSFLDHLALAGFDVFALDVRGYGTSTRSAEMDAAPEDGVPIGRTETGIRDLGSAVDFVRGRGGFAHVRLFGMSWGGSVAGAFAGERPDTVSRLALVAPQWLRRGSSPLDTGGPLGAYRNVVVADMEARWRGAAPEAKRQTLIPPGWFAQWADASLATDPAGARTGFMRAVNGPVADIRDHWAQGRPFTIPAGLPPRPFSFMPNGMPMFPSTPLNPTFWPSATPVTGAGWRSARGHTWFFSKGSGCRLSGRSAPSLPKMMSHEEACRPNAVLASRWPQVSQADGGAERQERSP